MYYTNLVSQSRSIRVSYGNTEELPDILHNDSDIVLFPISITRFAAQEASKILATKGYKVSVIHQLWLKPYIIKSEWKNILLQSKFGGIVLDDDYVDGVARPMAHELMLETSKPVDVMGLEPRTAGFHPDVDNLPPTAEKIVEKVLGILNNDKNI